MGQFSVRVDRGFSRRLWVAVACAGAIIAVFAGSARAAAPAGEVYVGDLSFDQVSQFGYNAAGALAPLPYSTVPASTDSAFVAVTPNGKYVYVANEGYVNVGVGSISQYAVDPSGLLEGSLVPLTPATIPTGRCAHGIAVNHTSTTVYVANRCDNTLGEYRIGSNGTLSAIGTVATGTNPYGVAAAADGKAVYVADNSGIAQYTAGSTGLLTPDSPSHVALAGGACPAGVAVSPNSKSVYAADPCNGYTYHLTAATNGTLTFSDLKGGAGQTPFFVAVTPTGRTVYATDNANARILQYAAGTTGAITPIGTAAAGNKPTGIAVAPSGKSAYALSQSDDTIWQYSVATSGVLTPMGSLPLPAGSDAYGLAVRK